MYARYLVPYIRVSRDLFLRLHSWMRNRKRLIVEDG
jgi:hypothetical protein